jgi:hypothetical protein
MLKTKAPFTLKRFLALSVRFFSKSFSLKSRRLRARDRIQSYYDPFIKKKQNSTSRRDSISRPLASVSPDGDDLLDHAAAPGVSALALQEP